MKHCGLKKTKYNTFIDAMKSVDKSKFVEPEKIVDFILTYDYLQGYRTNETLKNVVLEIGTKTGFLIILLIRKLIKMKT